MNFPQTQVSPALLHPCRYHANPRGMAAEEQQVCCGIFFLSARLLQVSEPSQDMKQQKCDLSLNTHPWWRRLRQRGLQSCQKCSEWRIVHSTLGSRSGTASSVFGEQNFSLLILRCPLLRSYWSGGSSGSRLALQWFASSGLQYNMGVEGARSHKRGVLLSPSETSDMVILLRVALNALHWMDVAESELRRKLMSRKQAAEAYIAGSASRKIKKCRYKNSNGMLSEKTQKILLLSEWIKAVCEKKLVF